MSCQRTEIRVRSIVATLDKAEVKRTNKTDVWIVADACCVYLVRRSRARGFRDPQTDSVLEEPRRIYQQDSSRDSYPPSGFLGRGLR